jgi:AcrR family transcriptional regulator
MRSGPTPRKRVGRRPGGGGQSRTAILTAARQLFAKQGFRGTTTRAIATKAGVDVALVHYFFQSKEKLFSAAIDVPVAPEQLKAVLSGADGGPPLGESVVRFFLEHVFTSRNHAAAAMVRAAVADPGCIPTLRSTIETTIVSAAASVLRGPQAHLRAELLGAQVVGLFIVRHIVRVEPLASASTEEVARLLGPAVEAILGR